ncbi:MAG: hypothetical protein ACK4FJ_00245 [Ferrovibrio sp.]|jgi:flagellar motor switch protein FliG|uniref:hypothetical protein n=1 Tax=Ferrovibrio sp. TaxID=1917215 RepID=UPI00391B990D
MSREKLVAFLRVAGPERTAEILKRLPPQEALAVRQALDQMPAIPSKQVDQAADAAATFVAAITHNKR